MCDSKQKSSYEHGPDFERMVRIFFLPYLGNRSKSDPYSYTLFCLESHILSFTKLLQIPPESACSYTMQRTSHTKPEDGQIVWPKHVVINTIKHQRNCTSCVNVIYCTSCVN